MHVTFRLISVLFGLVVACAATLGQVGDTPGGPSLGQGSSDIGSARISDLDPPTEDLDPIENPKAPVLPDASPLPAADDDSGVEDVPSPPGDEPNSEKPVEPWADSEEDKKLDPVLQKGRELFEQQCTQCHEASVALEVDQGLSDWLVTIRDMALRAEEDEDAELPESDWLPIASYLASRSADASDDGDEAMDDKSEGDDEMDSPERRQQIAAGQAAFNRGCLQCHDAARSTSKRKSVSAWRATISRMAAKPDANIARSDWQNIAVYLASLGSSGSGGGSGMTDGGTADDEFESTLSTFATIAPVWRVGTGDSVLENQGFSPELWVGAEWRPNRIMTGRVNACVTCHVQGSEGSRFELAEGLIEIDVLEALEMPSDDQHVSVQGGRLIVPFGAFSAQSHPGAFKTATRPLMYNMGLNVNRNQIGPAVLPLPYSDEGVLFHASKKLCCCCCCSTERPSLTFDAYLVNGLQGGLSGIDFFRSRDYVDNNREPAFGSRLTIGSSHLRLGSSFMVGQHNSIADGGVGPTDKVLNYSAWGVDVVARCTDWFRVQAEYAVRVTDQFKFAPAIGRFDEELDGFYVETGIKLCDSHNLEFIARYDSMNRQGDIPISGSSLGEKFHVGRITTGISMTLAGGSELRINHEHWRFPDVLDHENLVAVRWVASF